ncbi:MAG: hypothetical protein R2831_01740 [Chitinophagaceae bacterium]
MNKNNLFVFISLLSLVVFLAAWATPQQVKIAYAYHTFFACKHTDSIYVNKKDLISLSVQRLCAKDSAFTSYPIYSFDITYAERGLYQDSTGMPIVVTDYSFDKCQGDTLPMRWISIFQERAYPGDTIFIDNVKALDKNNKSISCKGFKLVVKR